MKPFSLWTLLAKVDYKVVGFWLAKTILPTLIQAILVSLFTYVSVGLAAKHHVWPYDKSYYPYPPKLGAQK